MNDLWQHLKQRKLVQWAVAYAAAAFALLQGIDIVAQQFGWAETLQRGITLAMVLGFFVTLVLAWYHGERGAQKVSGTELLLLSLVLMVGGGLLWKFAPGATDHALTAATQPASAVEAKPAAAIPAKSIAVLPFENLSEDKGNAYFADGMQDLILTKLADIGDLKVISRTSTKKYASRPDDLKTIARQLGVATILEGSVQKAGDQVLINVQLIDANTDGHLWAESYTRDLKNIFGVEGEVAQKIADALRAKLSPAETNAVAKVPTRNPQAFDAYLRAGHYQRQASDTSLYATYLPKAVAAYQQAVQLDPEFALAWARLADVQMWSIEGGVGDRAAALRAAQDSVQRALALAPDLPEAHLAQSHIDAVGLRNVEAARVQTRRALQLRPNYAEAVAALGYTDPYDGSYAQAITHLEQALQLDPENSEARLTLAYVRTSVGDYAGARRTLRRLLAVAPDNINAYTQLGQIELLQHGDAAAALKVMDGAPSTAETRSAQANSRINLLVMQRDYAAALRILAELPPKAGKSRTSQLFQRGFIEWSAGARDKARPYLLQADELLRTSQANDDSTTQRSPCWSRAWVLAMLNRRDEALQQVACALQSDRKIGWADSGLVGLDNLAHVHLMLGDNDVAIEALGKLMATPGHQAIESPATLRADPFWDPIRKNPRFQTLLTKYTDQPAEQAGNGAGDE